MKIILLSLCFCVKIKLWSNHIFISSWLLSRLVYVVFFCAFMIWIQWFLQNCASVFMKWHCCQHLVTRLKADADGAERDWRTCGFTATTVEEFGPTDRKRTALVSKEGIYNRKSGERMLGQDNPLSDRRNCWHSFHTERRFEMNQGRAERAASRLLISITESRNKELQLGWKSALRRCSGWWWPD